MARDYKDRGAYTGRRDVDRHPGKKTGRWILLGILVIGLGGFLVYVRMDKKTDKPDVEKVAVIQPAPIKAVPQKVTPVEKVEKPAPPIGPKFDFYTILPQAEVIVPEHEIKTRIREELTGKTRATQYILQAGSFRDVKDAEKLKADLVVLGIVSKIEKAKVGEVIWHRVKLGPYEQLASVETIKTRLKKSNLDVMITEIPKAKSE